MPRGFWKKPENRKRFFQSVVLARFPEIALSKDSQEFSAEFADKLHSLTKEEVYKAGGGSMLLHEYSDSIVDAIRDLFGDSVRVTQWKFAKAPAKFWDSKANRLEFFKAAALNLGVASMDDWYRIPSKSVYALGGMFDLFDRAEGFSDLQSL